MWLLIHAGIEVNLWGLRGLIGWKQGARTSLTYICFSKYDFSNSSLFTATGLCTYICLSTPSVWFIFVRFHLKVNDCISFDNHIWDKCVFSINLSSVRFLQQRNSSMKDAEEFPVATHSCSNCLWSILSGEILPGKDFLYEQTVRISIHVFQTSFIDYQWPTLL